MRQRHKHVEHVNGSDITMPLFFKKKFPSKKNINKAHDEISMLRNEQQRQIYVLSSNKNRNIWEFKTMSQSSSRIFFLPSLHRRS